MMRPRKKQPLPMLLGEPSPSLAKIMKMNMVDLAARIETLKTEAARLGTRIGVLKTYNPVPADKIANLQLQIARLQALEKAATDRLAFKKQRKEQWDLAHPDGKPSPRPARPPRDPRFSNRPPRFGRDSRPPRDFRSRP